MDPRLRIVTQLPLSELWDDTGPIEAARGAQLGKDQVTERLRRGSAAVAASVGESLRWLRGKELFDWWKREAKPRLVDPAAEGWRLEDFPDERCWVASEWTLSDGSVVLGFEEFH